MRMNIQVTQVTYGIEAPAEMAEKLVQILQYHDKEPKKVHDKSSGRATTSDKDASSE